MGPTSERGIDQRRALNAEEVRRLIEQIRRSNLFDSDWYLGNYPDAVALGMDAIEHYVRFGIPLGRRANPGFDAVFSPGALSMPRPTQDCTRLAYVVWDWPALSQTFVRNEVRALIAAGIDVAVYFHKDPDLAASMDFSVPTHRVESAEHLRKLVVAHQRDVLHSPFAYPATTLLTWPCAEATGLGFTFMPGGVDISHHKNIGRNRVGELAASPRCLGVLAIGSHHRRVLLDAGVPPDKLVMERQSVELPPFCPKPVAGEPTRVLSIGRFVEKKGFVHLLAAAELLPQCNFDIYGYGPLDRELRTRAASARHGNVRIHGALQSTFELHSAYADADLMVVPCVVASDGDVDGTPTVLMEAMGAGLPVISTRVSNIPDVIEDQVTGFLCEPGDPPALAGAIGLAAALDPGLRMAMLAAARQFVSGYTCNDQRIATLKQLWRREQG